MPLLEKLETLSFRLFGRIAPSIQRSLFPGLKSSLEMGRVRIYYETYVSLMLLMTVLTLPVSALGIVLFLIFHLLPLLALVPVPLFLALGFLVVPKNNASDRSTSLEREIPFASAYISVMASGGIAPYTSFKRLTQVQLMPAMSKEARDIIKDVEVCFRTGGLCSKARCVTGGISGAPAGWQSIP